MNAKSILAILCLATAICSPVSGKDNPSAPGLARTTVLLIRHAEKPDDGTGLAPAGVARANTYVRYFTNYRINGATIKLTALFAAANSSSSHREYLTLLPLSQATGLTINTPYKDDDYAKLADLLQSTDHGRDVLVCWHEGKLPDLIRALGGDARELLPDGDWPEDQYGWVIQLRYDKHGRLKDAQRIVEGF